MDGVRGEHQQRRHLSVRFLVRLHPAEFRERFGRGMIEAYRHGLEQRTGAGPRARYWLATLADLGIGVVTVRVSGLRSRIGRRGWLAVPAAGSGTLAASVCGVAVCCPAHAALLGPIGLTGATLATVMEPIQPIVLAVSVGVLVLTSVLGKRLAIIGATTMLAFAAFLPLFHELLGGHWH